MRLWDRSAAGPIENLGHWLLGSVYEGPVQAGTKGAPVGKASSAKRAAKAGGTRDHTVPQMYLRHFARHAARRRYELTVRRLGKINEPFPVTPTGIAAETGYYWGISADGVPHHAAEGLFTSLESRADTVLKVLLNDPQWALTPQWPLSLDQRHVLAWWMAAQILRTTRQRKRLTHRQAEAPDLTALPDEVHRLAENNPHLRYIVENIVTLALTLEARPWALGFSDMCLLTSDTPVVVWNRPDDEDQVRAAALSDIMLPLDPHRFLFLPGPATREDDHRKQVDHLMHAKGAVGMALVGVAYDVADQFVIHHPEHDPWKHWKPTGRAQPKSWEGETHSGPQYVLQYPVFPLDQNIERRWTVEHP
ncbi:DUF4238 domain-containing protein [Streptomyces sp. NBC_00513]|uniref:DUF4238 domain-containing protein n=1 Tax=unclassified Streptomyces TaxID=2593676 RepID=UPI002250C076|nr:DUF4238 domain-containing protein [Streptomyces sp. NBC_00424]MCX5079268.1 DUF4238 domain-containing protein [Streptomyces sp. NBC_00424]WUD39174.1 DUF4238 domain-containing protein [Streptomyces sp. NBC_00513]